VYYKCSDFIFHSSLEWEEEEKKKQLRAKHFSGCIDVFQAVIFNKIKAFKFLYSKENQIFYFDFSKNDQYLACGGD